MRAYPERFRRIQESFSEKRNFRRFTFVGQSYCINEDIMKELALIKF
jgi:hypothetical protein